MTTTLALNIGPKIRLTPQIRPRIVMTVKARPPTRLTIMPGAAVAQNAADRAEAEADAAAQSAQLLEGSLSASFILKEPAGSLASSRALQDSPTIAFDWSVSGTVSAEVPHSAIIYSKIQDVGANRILGSIAGGVVEEIVLTSAGRALLDDSNNAAQRATLGLDQINNTSDIDKPVSLAQGAADALRLLLTGGSLSGFLMLHADPVNTLHAATKQYVDNLIAGLDPKASCRLGTIANDTLLGLAARDGITPVSGDRVFVSAQTAPAQNGIYVASAGAWLRAADADTWNELIGAHFWVEEGTNGDKAWVCTNNAGGTLGTTAVTFVQFGGTGAYQPLDADLTAIASLGTTSFGRALLELANAAAAATVLGVGSGDSPQFAAVNIGHATDATLARSGAGDLTVEGNRIFRVGGADVPVADGGTGASDAAGARASLGDIDTLTLSCSDESTPLTTGTNKMRWRIPWACAVSAIPNASLNTAQPSGSIFTVDVNKNGTSILTTKLTVDNTETDSASAAIPATLITSTVTFAAGDIIGVDIDQAGASGAAGLKVTLFFLRT